MLKKGIYKNRSTLCHLLILLTLIITGSVFSSLIGIGSFMAIYGLNANIYDHTNALLFVQLISAIGTFLLPSIGTAWFCSNDIKNYLSIGKTPNSKILFYTFISMLLLSPFISFTGTLNEMMNLPEFLKPVEDWMRIQEETARQLTESLLNNPGILAFISNLIVIAIVAGITEEFLFRGALQKVIERGISNHHIVIWVAAILFSAFHLQFFGFIPRLLMGAYFGYLLYWGKNIWVPVFAHFMNNAFAVIFMSNGIKDTPFVTKEMKYITGEIQDGQLLPFGIMATCCLILFYFCAKKLRDILTVKDPSF